METPDEDQSGRDTRRCSGPVKPVARILSDRFPTYEEGDLALFETGSIVFHIAERPRRDTPTREELASLWLPCG